MDIMPIDMNNPEALDKYKRYQTQAIKILLKRFPLKVYPGSGSPTSTADGFEYEMKFACDIYSVARVFSRYIERIREEYANEGTEINRMLSQITETAMDLGWLE
jgi:hypothetical protein